MGFCNRKEIKDKHLRSRVISESTKHKRSFAYSSRFWLVLWMRWRWQMELHHVLQWKSVDLWATQRLIQNAQVLWRPRFLHSNQWHSWLDKQFEQNDCFAMEIVQRGRPSGRMDLGTWRSNFCICAQSWTPSANGLTLESTPLSV